MMDRIERWAAICLSVDVEHSWTFAIDRGGTFTDVVARSSDGRVRVEKLLSENPGR